jgi:hypothetical protein
VSEAWVPGGCLCGAFEVALPSKWCASCHCSMCRRAHGAPYVTWVGFAAGQLRVVEGELARYRSSEEATRGFCGRCGSPLTFESTRWAGEVHVARAAIPGAIDRQPQAHVFVSDQADWVTIHDDLPKRGGKSGTEPL